MKINFAHLKENSTSGGYINFAVFEAKSTSGSDSANNEVLANLTAKARASGLKVDQSALAYKRGSRVQFYGDKNLIAYLSKKGVPNWTHSLSA